MKRKTDKKSLRGVRHRKIRMIVKGTLERPRLAVFKSSQHIYAQVIDDELGTTLLAVSDREVSDGKKTKKEKAVEVGELVAQHAEKAKITKVVFDRGGFPYAGRVKALGDSARNKGLQF
ncbi:MAG: 50S ribosomal protein L18 [Parcubacteria group bacterium]|nr:50S ribosomal protein L18 [Parcubacteria group bacterium]